MLVVSEKRGLRLLTITVSIYGQLEHNLLRTSDGGGGGTYYMYAPNNVGVVCLPWGTMEVHVVVVVVVGSFMCVRWIRSLLSHHICRTAGRNYKSLLR